jgi:flagellar basal-body rod protein FlgB
VAVTHVCATRCRRQEGGTDKWRSEIAVSANTQIDLTRWQPLAVGPATDRRIGIDLWSERNVPARQTAGSHRFNRNWYDYCYESSRVVRVKATHLKIGFDNALGLHASALGLRAQRTEVLAGNIANADTPGFQARDLDFKAELAKQTEAASVPRVRTTHAQHMPVGSSTSTGVDLLYRSPLMGSFDENSVDTQLEQAAFAQNNMQFQAALRFLNGRFQGLMTAVRGE